MNDLTMGSRKMCSSLLRRNRRATGKYIEHIALSENNDVVFHYDIYIDREESVRKEN